MCFGIVFAALIEFACINFIDTLIRRIKKKEKERMRLKVNYKNELLCRTGSYIKQKIEF